MINTDFMVRDFGIENPLPDNLIQAALEFMMVFYYCEERFFHRYCQFRDASSYATSILSRQNADPGIVIDSTFNFLNDRYILSHNADDRRHALVLGLNNSQTANDTIRNSFINHDGSHQSKLIACLYVIIRLRHNLFHANKFEAMNNDPEGQRVLISQATTLLGHLLKNSR